MTVLVLRMCLAVVLILFLVFRRSRLRRTPELTKALELAEKDPAAGREQLAAYFQKEAAEERARRSALWAQAQTDIRAAKDLRRRLLEDLKTDEFARREISKDPNAPGVALQDIDTSERNTRQELAKIDALIAALKER